MPSTTKRWKLAYDFEIVLSRTEIGANCAGGDGSGFALDVSAVATVAAFLGAMVSV